MKDLSIPVISIVGRKNSGKTTLIIKLIPELKNRGYKIGTIKHDAHNFEIDKEGKDSWKHKESGASEVLIVSSSKLAFIKDVNEEKNLHYMINKYFDDVDLVITEGYKKYDMPKIEVFRSDGIEKEPIFLNSKDLIAIVSERKFRNIRTFTLNQTKEIVDLIEQYIKEVK